VFFFGTTSLSILPNIFPIVSWRAHDNIPDDTSPNADAEADLVPTFKDGMRIFPCPEVTVVDPEHTLTSKTHFVCPQNFVLTTSIWATTRNVGQFLPNYTERCPRRVSFAFVKFIPM
jgi:hypothetical protein